MHIVATSGDSYRMKHSAGRRCISAAAEPTKPAWTTYALVTKINHRRAKRSPIGASDRPVGPAAVEIIEFMTAADEKDCPPGCSDRWQTRSDEMVFDRAR